MPVILSGNEEQQKKYLGRMIEEPLMCVSDVIFMLLFSLTFAALVLLHTFCPRIMIAQLGSFNCKFRFKAVMPCLFYNQSGFVNYFIGFHN